MKIIGKTAAIVTKSIKDAPEHTKNITGAGVSKIKSGSTSFSNKVKEGWNDVMEKDESDDIVVFELTDDVIEAQS
jgi:hypothetical protein